MREDANRIDESHRKELLKFLLVKMAAVRQTLFYSKMPLKSTTLETNKCIVAKHAGFWYTLVVNNTFGG